MSVDKEVADQLLEALVDASIVNDIATVPLTLPEQIRFVQKNINVLPVQDRKMVTQVIVAAQYRHLLRESSEGLVIQMERLPNYVITEMYKMIADKLSE